MQGKKRGSDTSIYDFHSFLPKAESQKTKAKVTQFCTCESGIYFRVNDQSDFLSEEFKQLSLCCLDSRLPILGEVWNTKSSIFHSHFPYSLRRPKCKNKN